MKGKLYLIPSVISTNGQNTIPDQVKEIIKECNYFLAENIRTARRYISSLKLGLTIEDLHFELLDKNTKESDVQKLMKPVFTGKSIGILSESGCPGVADPGAGAVKWAHKNDVEVIPLVGPSSILLALMASGFNGQKFAFHGYLPVDKKDLGKNLKELETISAKNNQSQIFIETPYRNNQVLQVMLTQLRPDTKLCICRDVTGSEELIKTQEVAKWKASVPDLHKRPVVFVFYAGC